MAYLWIFLLTALAIFGHGALWVTFINRLNSLPLHYIRLRRINRPAFVLCGLIAVGMIVWVIMGASQLGQPRETTGYLSDPISQWVFPYFILCCAMACFTTIVWVFRRVFHQRWSGVRTLSQEFTDIGAEADIRLFGRFKSRLCALVPGNQALHLETRTLQVQLPNLPPALDGFSIVHLTDLHFAGHVQRPFFDEVVRRANAMDGDIIVITGDILDKRTCWPWLAPTLGQLRSKHGVYFIFGNHDSRDCPPEELRAALTDLGLINVGGTQHSFQVNNATVMLVGNELPWLKPPVEVTDLPTLPDDALALSIVLSHSPDQITWASQHGFDLLLAGHVHGGQYRVPLIGPLLTPSRFGVKYSGGTFHVAPTVMHVSRGLSGMTPLRINCPPELTKLVLRSST